MASDRAALEAFFETFDIPTEGQYTELIASVPNIVDDYASSPAFDISTKTSITAIEARVLSSTPKTLVSAGGAGTIIALKFCAIRLNFVAPVFGSNQPFNFGNPSGTLPQSSVTSVALSTANAFRVCIPFPGFLINEIQFVDNEDLELSTFADLVTGGSSLDVYTVHNIITL